MNHFLYSPVIVASDANLEVAGRRIIFGRFLNCGQMCIAPDHVICMGSQRDKLIEVFKKTLKEFFGEVACNLYLSSQSTSNIFYQLYRIPRSPQIMGV